MHEVDLVGNRHQILRRHRHELGVAAGVVHVPEHFVARALVIAARDARRAAPAAHARLQHHTLSCADALAVRAAVILKRDPDDRAAIPELQRFLEVAVPQDTRIPSMREQLERLNAIPR